MQQFRCAILGFALTFGMGLAVAAYPDRPILAVSAAIIRNGRVLLTQRARGPANGVWTMPGGARPSSRSARRYSPATDVTAPCASVETQDIPASPGA